ncbi:MAG: TetR family transcriptional regulator C-terminal domain-containing protein [Deltaproteobacteria bacterium]|nr:TetR family transcriptional regulator C-terminal domain-containing protein [Deltaproteobacteria bacterium]
MPESVRELRRGQIIAAARRIVAGDGLEALTFGALERRLAFTRGVITYHFRDKDELVDAVLASAVDDIDRGTRREVDAAADPADKVRAAIHGMVHGFLVNPEAGRVLLAFWGRLTSDPHVRKVNAALYARYREETARLLRAGTRAGAFAQVDARVVAVNVVGAVIGIVTQAYFDPGAVDVEACVDEAARALRARLVTVSPPARPGSATARAPAPRRRRR